MKQKIEVWCEDNYDYMKDKNYPAKVAEFSSNKEALDYIYNKLDEQLLKIAKNFESVEDLIRAYKFGGTNYYIQDSTNEPIGFSSWDYVEKNAKKYLKIAKSSGLAEK